jgi:hypothetical protein
MPNFALSLTDPVTDSVDITISNGVLTIVDHSNYSTSDEVGHLLANFTDFYQVMITLPSGGQYLFSSLGDGDEAVVPPSAGDPTVTYTYPGGDGQYWVTVYALPTYDAGTTYTYSALNPVYAYSGVNIYKLLQTGTGQIADSTYWEEVTDVDLLPSKYRINQRVVIYADSKRYYARKIYNANVLNNLIGANWEKLFRDPDFITAVEFFIGINSIPVMLAASRFAEIDLAINLMKQEASSGEVL